MPHWPFKTPPPLAVDRQTGVVFTCHIPDLISGLEPVDTMGTLVRVTPRREHASMLVGWLSNEVAYVRLVNESQFRGAG